MSRNLNVNFNSRVARRYGFFNFMFDLFMVCITSGLWVIWIFVREMRNR